MKPTWEQLVEMVEHEKNSSNWVLVRFHQYHLSYMDSSGSPTIYINKAVKFNSRDRARRKLEKSSGRWRPMLVSDALEEAKKLQEKYS